MKSALYYSLISKDLLWDFPFFFSSFLSSIILFVLLILQAIKPTVLIGSSGVGKTFTKEVVEAMASFNEVWYYSLSLCDMYKSSLNIKTKIGLNWHVETSHSGSFQPNITIWVHSRRSLHMEQGTLYTFSGYLHQAFSVLVHINDHIFFHYTG